MRADAQLLAQVRKGNEDAFEGIYDRYSRLVFSIALAVLNDVAASNEITQEVFLKLWDRADMYDPKKGTFYSWLSSITRNRAIDALRSRASRPIQTELSWAEADHSEGADPEHTAALVIDQQRVRRALAAISLDQRNVIALAYFKGLSHSEIADTLDLPLGTVKGRIRLGLLRLRDLLEAESVDETSKPPAKAYVKEKRNG